MILGRPVNQAVALAGAIFDVIAGFNIAGFNPTAVQIGSVNILILALMGFIAGKPPTLNPADTYNVVTPAGQPPVIRTVAHLTNAEKVPTVKEA